MLERMKIEEPRELFTHKLGAALRMETTVAGMLRTLVEKAQSPELKVLLRRHADETDHQIANLHEAFAYSCCSEECHRECVETSEREIAAMVAEGLSPAAAARNLLRDLTGKRRTS